MFQEIVEFLQSINPIYAALLATLFTWLLTALGAALVFFMSSTNKTVMDGMLGFTGGVMIAASVWSLIIPSIEMTDADGFLKVFPAVSGFLLGAIFIFGLDKILPHFHVNLKRDRKSVV